MGLKYQRIFFIFEGYRLYIGTFDCFKVIIYFFNVSPPKKWLTNNFCNGFPQKFYFSIILFWCFLTQNFIYQLFFQCFFPQHFTYQLFFDFSTSKNFPGINWNHPKMTKNDLKTSNITWNSRKMTKNDLKTYDLKIHVIFIWICVSDIF